MSQCPHRRVAAIALLLAVLSACTVLPEAETFRLFRLPYPAAESLSEKDPDYPLTLRVRSPRANPILGSQRIAVVPEGSQITSYSGARWSEPAPDLIRDRLIEAFLKDGQLRGVYDEENRLPADLELTGKLRAFQSEYTDGSPRVRLLLDLRLTDGGGRQLLAARRFAVTKESADEDVESVIAGFGRATHRLSRLVVDWTLKEIAELQMQRNENPGQQNRQTQ